MTKLLDLTRKQTIVFVSLAFALAAGAAVAAPAATNNQSKPGAPTDQRRGPGPQGHDPFAHWDQDGDGKVVLKDLPAKPQAHLATVDTNKDGTLTREEFDNGREQLRATREKQLDTNKDGKVSADERKAGRGRDGKCPLSDAERKSRMQQRFGKDDTNNDGFLVQTEIPRRWEHMKIADTNNDSKISLSELETAFESGKLRPPQRSHREGKGRGHAQQRSK